MCNNFRVVGLVIAALGLGVVLATMFPPWLLVWILGVVIIVIGIMCIR